MADDLAWLDATAQAELVRRGEVAPIELVDAAIARIEKLNPELNAVITTRFDESRAEAVSPSLPDGPFRGVPFLLKDLHAVLAGMPIYMGNRVLRDLDWRAPADTPLGARFQSAGFITLGKTNVPELGRQPTTQPLAFGATRNPWDPTRSTAGSSGGAAAAVASGMVAVAHANDAGGSTRMPAAWCGLVGLKSSRGRIALPPPALLPAELVLSRSVRDTAAVLDAVHGPVAGDWFVAPPPVADAVAAMHAPVTRRRVGILTEQPDHAVDPECIAAVERAARLLEDAGHLVEVSHPGALFDGGLQGRQMALHGADTHRRIEMLGELTGRPFGADDVEPWTWFLAEMGRSVSAAQLLGAWEWCQDWTRRVVAWWDDHDVLVTPTTAVPPLPLTDLEVPAGNPAAAGAVFRQVMPFVPQWNITGQPAISLPLHWTAGDLPCGVQLVAAPGREDVLIELAAQLEAAAPWADRRPLVAA
jgi:amidase